jgi:hypothetical protein
LVKVTSLSSDKTQSLIIGGVFGDNLDIGNISLEPVNNYDNYIAKIHWTGTTGKNETFSENKRITVYPNPGNNIINILQPENDEIVFLELRDKYGRSVIRKEIITRPGKLNIDVSDLAPGVYFINAHTKNNKSLSEKLIVLE